MSNVVSKPSSPAVHCFNKQQRLLRDCQILCRLAGVFAACLCYKCCFHMRWSCCTKLSYTVWRLKMIKYVVFSLRLFLRKNVLHILTPLPYTKPKWSSIAQLNCTKSNVSYILRTLAILCQYTSSQIFQFCHLAYQMSVFSN